MEQHPLRGQARRRRSGPLPRTRDGRAARAGPPAGRRRAGAGQDADREDAGADAARQLQAHPVHARPGAGRPGRHAHLQPAQRRVQHLARPGLHAPAAGRRDQPRAGQGAERAARSDAGAPGHDRRRDAQGARAVPRDGDAEPDRDRRHLPAARSAGRPLHDEGAGRLPERGRRVRDRAARDRRAVRRLGGRQHGPARRAAARMPAGLRRPVADAVRGQAGQRDPAARALRPRRPGQVPDLRRQPARDDRPDRGRPRARLHARPRLRAARRT